MSQDQDDELAREIRAHLELEAEDYVNGGMSAEEAHYAAIRAFGNVTRVREDARSEWTLVWWDNLLQDLSYALRTLARSPGFVTTAVLTLGLGIGTTTAVYQLFDALSLRSLPVVDPDRLVILDLADRAQWRGRRTSSYPVFTNPLWEEFRNSQQVFSGVLAWSNADLRLDDGDQPLSAMGIYVNGEFFEVLGVKPLLGRVFTTADDRPGCVPRAVVSHGFWQRHFGGDPAAIGRIVRVNSRQIEIAGVTPADFAGLEVGRSFDIAVPVCAQAALGRGENWLANEGVWWLTVMGRLPSGESLETANAQLAGLSPGLFAATLPSGFSADNASNYLRLQLRATPGGAGVSSLRSRYGDPLLILLGATGLILLITCTNVANLILARASSREREFAVRLALGASRRRVLAQLMIEYGLLALGGAAAGLFLAMTLNAYLIGFFGSGLSLALRVDAKLLAFVLGTAVLTCLAFGFIPAWRASGASAVEAMRGSGRSLSASRRSFALRQTLVISQLSLSLVLLFGALIMAGTLRNLLAVNAGFHVKGVELLRADFSQLETPSANRTALKRELLSRIRSAHGVTAAAEVRHLPLGGTGSSIDVWRDGSDANAQAAVRLNAMSPGYLEAMGIPLMAGRDFSTRDASSSPHVAIVNPSFIRRLGLTGNPIGQTFYGRSSPSGPEKEFEIVGVVADTKYFTLREDFLPIVFVPITQVDDARSIADFVVRTTSALNAPGSPVRQAVTDINPRIGIDVRAFDATVREGLLRERLMAGTAGLLGILATTIAAVGLYGVVALLVVRRTNEIGVRMALGAKQIGILTMVLRQAGRLLVLGLGLGAALALMASSLLRSVVFGVETHDLGSVALACVTLAGVALVASYLPARRAARLAPLSALRNE